MSVIDSAYFSAQRITFNVYIVLGVAIVVCILAIRYAGKNKEVPTVVFRSVLAVVAIALTFATIYGGLGLLGSFFKIIFAPATEYIHNLHT